MGLGGTLEAPAGTLPQQPDAHLPKPWLQTFTILVHVIGEKAPEYCLPLFFYMASIREAHRVYKEVAWLQREKSIQHASPVL